MNHFEKAEHSQLEKYSWWRSESGQRHFCLIDKIYTGPMIELESVVLLEHMSTQPEIIEVNEMLRLIAAGKMVKADYTSEHYMTFSPLKTVAA